MKPFNLRKDEELKTNIELSNRYHAIQTWIDCKCKSANMKKLRLMVERQDAIIKRLKNNILSINNCQIMEN